MDRPNEKETFIDKKFVETQNRSPLSKINHILNMSVEDYLEKWKKEQMEKMANRKKQQWTMINQTKDNVSKYLEQAMCLEYRSDNSQDTEIKRKPPLKDMFPYIASLEKENEEPNYTQGEEINQKPKLKDPFPCIKRSEKNNEEPSVICSEDITVLSDKIEEFDLCPVSSTFSTMTGDRRIAFEKMVEDQLKMEKEIDKLSKEAPSVPRKKFSFLKKGSGLQRFSPVTEGQSKRCCTKQKKNGSTITSKVSKSPNKSKLQGKSASRQSTHAKPTTSSQLKSVVPSQSRPVSQPKPNVCSLVKPTTAVPQTKFTTSPQLNVKRTFTKSNLDVKKTTERKSPCKNEEKSVQSTILKPFNLTESRKRFRDEEEGDKPFAEKIVDYFKTSKRFRSTSCLTVYNPPTKQNSPQFVRPKTPKFIAGKRRRQTRVLSHEQKLQLEAQQVKEFQFHAKPFNSALKNHPFVPKIEKKNCIIPKPFKLETQNRALTHKHDQSINEPSYEFHARKVPKSVLEGPKGLKEKPSVPPTLPVSPKLSLKNREVKWKAFSSGTSSNEVFKFKAKPAPTPKAYVSLPKIPKKLATKPEPFSFHEKDKERFNKKEQKIEEEIKEQLKSFQFHAQDIPSSVLKPSRLSYIKKKSPTVPCPFNLRSSSQSYNEIPKVSNQVKFKAKPATVLKKRPFIPMKSLLPPIECVEFKLHTKERAIEREYLKEQRQSIRKNVTLLLRSIKKNKNERKKKLLKNFVKT